jgi:hypothetical protein
MAQRRWDWAGSMIPYSNWACRRLSERTNALRGEARRVVLGARGQMNSAPLKSVVCCRSYLRLSDGTGLANVD